MHQEWMKEKSEKFLYILMLRDYKFYIGQSTDPKKRIKKQFDGKGSAWTKVHPPVEVVGIKSIGNLDYKEAEDFENKLVLKYMKKYGWKNVRGRYFTNVDQEVVFKNILHHKEKGTYKIEFL